VTNTGRVSITDMVRIKSLVERARVVVVDVMGREEVSEEWGHEKDYDSSNAQGCGNEVMEGGEEGDRRWDMEVARVYEQTIVELGELLRNSGADGF
jgi:Subunit 11 of the general transcription factor TFIIH